MASFLFPEIILFPENFLFVNSPNTTFIHISDLSRLIQGNLFQVRFYLFGVFLFVFFCA